jgi:hypothetical protein
VDFTAVRTGHAGQDLDQSRLPRTVLTANRMDLTGGQLEIHMLERVHSAVRLAELRNTKEILRHDLT